MADRARLAELDQRIAAVRENIRVLTEQAAAYSGAADEERNADRIAKQIFVSIFKMTKRSELMAFPFPQPHTCCPKTYRNTKVDLNRVRLGFASKAGDE